MHSLWQRKQPYHAYQLRHILPILCELFLIGLNPHSPVMLRFNLTFLCVPHFWTYIYAMEIMLFVFMFMHIYMLRQ